MSELELTNLAIHAYHAYGSVTDFKNYQGLPMPEWNDLTVKIQAAWCAAAKFVFEYSQTSTQDPDHK